LKFSNQFENYTIIKMNICSICYDNEISISLTCPYCKFESCITCIRRFIEHLPREPSCMNCTKIWSIARASFQYESLDPSLIPLDHYDELNDPPLLKFQISNRSTIILSQELVSGIAQGQIKLWRN